MDKIEELLNVLDLPESEQWKWVTHADRVCEFFPSTEIFIQDPNQYLADLAFRLRDETKCLDDAGHSFDAREIVCCRASGWYEQERKAGRTQSSLHDAGIWFAGNAQPIHWIIAALIAKELSK